MNWYRIVNSLIATVWVAFGLFGKILPTDGRHEQIVAEILPFVNAELFTKLIGIGEIGLGILILTAFQSRKVALLQIALVLTMNVMEQLLAPQHLLFGSLNFLFSLSLCGLIYWNEFHHRLIHRNTKNTNHA